MSYLVEIIVLASIFLFLKPKPKQTKSPHLKKTCILREGSRMKIVCLHLVRKQQTHPCGIDHNIDNNY